MIRVTATFILSISMILLLLCIREARKIPKSERLYFIELSVITIAIDLLVLFSIIFSNMFLKRLSYGIYCALAGWFVYLMLLFCLYYLEWPKSRIRHTYPFIPILIFFFISNIVNVFTEHEMAFVQVYTSSKETLIISRSYVLHIIYEVFSLCMAIMAIGAIIQKIIISSQFIRFRYFLLSISFGVLIIGEVIYLRGDSIYDITPIVCTLATCSIFLVSIIYARQEVMRRSLTRVSREMDELLIVLNEKNICTYINESAVAFLTMCSCERTELEDALTRLLADNPVYQRSNPSGIRFPFTVGSKTYHFKLSFHSFWDEDRIRNVKKRYMGGFFILLNQTEEYEIRERQQYATRHDVLTGLYNMYAFEQAVKETLAAHPEEDYLIICSDIKEFKLINETYGSDAGDALLCRIAQKITEYSKPDWIYCRVGNDRFALMKRRDEHNDEHFLEAAKDVEFLPEDENYTVHIYFGIYEIDDPSLPVSAMCDRAFRAISAIKGTYKKLSVYEENMHKRAKQEQWMVDQLPTAISHGDIIPYLQAQTDKDGYPIGAEILVRWNHPERGLIPPGMFIPLFEENGMIATIDLCIWRQACEILQRWSEKGYPNSSLSVNISPQDINYMDIFEELTNLVNEFNLDPTRLKLEITETAIAQDFERQMNLVQRLRNFGFIVEMDDFGSGYSSLNLLKDMEIDVIKLDLVFLRKAKDGKRARTIIEMVVELARKLHIKMVVEGVETEEQRDYLVRIGCNTFQGYYFAKPTDLADFEAGYLS